MQISSYNQWRTRLFLALWVTLSGMNGASFWALAETTFLQKPRMPSQPTTTSEATLARAKRHHQRGRILPRRFTPKDLYDAYMHVYQSYTEKMRDDHAWTVVNEEDGAEVAILPDPDDPMCPYARFTLTIPAPVETLYDFVHINNWDKNMPKVDPFYKTTKVHGSYAYADTEMYLCRKISKHMWPFKPRELVMLFATGERLEDGTLVAATMSVNTDKVPRRSDHVRAFQESLAFYTPLEQNTKTKMTVICRIDLNDSSDDGTGGVVPMWLFVKTLGRSAAKAMLMTRDAIVKQHQC